MSKERCSNCKYCRRSKGEYICNNEESDGYGCEVTTSDCCSEWEGKNNE